jgi:hypothetical protein
LKWISVKIVEVRQVICIPQNATGEPDVGVLIASVGSAYSAMTAFTAVAEGSEV